MENILSDKTNPIGFTVYYFGFSTWIGRILYLEDIYVEPDYRSKLLYVFDIALVITYGTGKGVATLMMKELCKV